MIESIYDYCDESGQLLYQVVRQRTPDGGKVFGQRRPIPGHAGEWIWSLVSGRYGKINGRWERLPDAAISDDCVTLPAVRQVPFRCQRFASEPTAGVIVVEGEKDVITLESLFGAHGTIVTTNSGGAGKWRRELGGFLSGRRVAVIPDNDEPGLNHALSVAASAIAYQAEAIRLVRWTPQNWPNPPEGGDVSDWLDERHAKALPAKKKQAVLELILASEVWAMKMQSSGGRRDSMHGASAAD